MAEILNNGVVVDKNHYYTNGELDDLKKIILNYENIIKQNKINSAISKLQKIVKRN